MFDKNYYKEKIEIVRKHLGEIFSQNEIENFTKHISEKLENIKPTLMVYGTYNSGKSTLINAIFGKEEMAKTGDTPETYKISSYEYNGFTIYDTPGINAPIEHEEVTREHLKKCEMVLFVISNDGSFEEEYIYNEISKIVKTDKPLLIVLNNKAGIEHDSEDVTSQMNKVNENLSKIGDRNGIKNIEERVDISIVHAKRALKGKVENKNTLLNKSGIIELENNIKNMFEKSGVQEVENGLKVYIEDFKSRALKIIDERIENPELQKVEEHITYLEKLKQRVENELQTIVSLRLAEIEHSVVDIFIAGGDGNSMLKDTVAIIRDEANRVLQKTQKELQNKTEKFTIEFKKLLLESDEILDVSIEEIPQKEEKTKAILFPIPPIPIIPNVMTIIVDIANAVVALWNIFQINKNSIDTAREEAKQQLEAKRIRVLALKNRANFVIQKIQRDANDSISTNIDEIFNNLIEYYKELSSKLNREHNELIKIKKEVNLL